MRQLLALLAILFLTVQLIGCEGNSGTEKYLAAGSGDGGISGTGITDGGIGGGGIVSTAPIDAFGSIYVNSIRYNVENADIFINNEPGNESDLKLGMYVRVNGTVNDDGQTGVATQVAYYDNLIGPIDAISLTSNGKYKALTILGQSILIHPEDTVYDGTTYETLAINDWVTVSGRTLRDSAYIAERVEVDSAPEPDQPIRFTATLTNMNGNALTFSNGYDVDMSSVETLPSNTLMVGQQAEVIGVLNADVVTARRLNTDIGYSNQSVGFEAGDLLTIDGPITFSDSSASAQISGVSINIQSATRIPAFYSFEDGSLVRISGQFDGAEIIANNLYILSLLEEGTLTALDTSANEMSVSLERFNQTLTVQLNAQTSYEDSATPETIISADDLTLGDRVTIAVTLNAANKYIATNVERIEAFTGVSDTDPGVSGPNSTLTISDEYRTSSPVTVQDVNVTSTGILSLTLDSYEAAEYGRIKANGSVTLTGALTLINDGLALNNGDRFDILDGAISGRFSSLNLPPLDAGLIWDLSSLYSTGEISVIGQPLQADSPMLFNSYTLAETQTLTVQLDDTPSSNNYGRIATVDTLDLSGDLIITKSITESAGDTFEILDWGTLASNSQFSNIQLPALSPGLTWDLNNLYVDGSVSIIQSPGQISQTPQLWVDASDAGSVVRNSEGTVGLWIDKSGLNNSYPQTTLQNRPTYRASETFMNNRASIEFDKTNDLLPVEGATIVGTDYTILVVEARNNTEHNWFLGSTETGVDRENGHFGYFNDNVLRMGHYNDDIDHLVDGYAVQTAQLTTFRYSAVDGKRMFVDGSLVSQDAAQTQPLLNNINWRIGNSYSNEFYGGNIAEIIVFNSALSDSDRNAVAQYLLSKYGISN